MSKSLKYFNSFMVYILISGQEHLFTLSKIVPKINLLFAPLHICSCYTTIIVADISFLSRCTLLKRFSFFLSFFFFSTLLNGDELFGVDTRGDDDYHWSTHVVMSVFYHGAPDGNCDRFQNRIFSNHYHNRTGIKLILFFPSEKKGCCRRSCGGWLRRLQRRRLRGTSAELLLLLLILLPPLSLKRVPVSRCARISREKDDPSLPII